jgi:thymidine kinase
MSVTFVLGPMFSGKTNYLHYVMRKYVSRGLSAVLYKHAMDTRYGRGALNVSHDGNKMLTLVKLLYNESLPADIPEEDVICIEEGQFLDGELLKKFCLDLLKAKKKVFVAGLLTMADGNKMWPSMEKALPAATKIKQLHGVCALCQGKAYCSRKVGGHKDQQVEVGADDMYIPTCHLCFPDTVPVSEDRLKRHRENIKKSIGF